MSYGRRATTPERFRRLSRLFEELLGLDPDEQDAVIRQRCGEDRALAGALRDLLRADRWSRSHDLVERLLAAEMSALGGGNDGDLRVGPWRVVVRLRSRLPGTAYLAERTEGGTAIRAVVRTFEPCVTADERAPDRFWRAFGRLRALDDPGVPRVLGSGVTDLGVPYVATEMIDGEGLIPWAERHGVDVRARLERFLPICRTVARAHRLGIAHGHLGPGRLLVTGDGGHRVGDLGITMLAHACASRPTEPGPGDDVLALGRSLHLLLTGSHPVEGAPDGPATPFLTSRSARDAASRVLLEGAVDAVVARALRVDPARRYPEAGALAEDLSRHLRGLPVLVAFDEDMPRRRPALSLPESPMRDSEPLWRFR